MERIMSTKSPGQLAAEYRYLAKRFELLAEQEENPDYKANFLRYAKHAHGLADSAAKKVKAKPPKPKRR